MTMVGSHLVASTSKVNVLKTSPLPIQLRLCDKAWSLGGTISSKVPAGSVAAELFLRPKQERLRCGRRLKKGVFWEAPACRAP